ncbi:MAG: bifunctional precorrin-2 dehydrogenase/sirohydrochlorin ferrochelatase [Prevotella sp.]|jgi:siroheme synthase-like protein|nr:bifunctional precorrin-2 dehydrogenase/sirohydrochlorin ferrochelatase [Prevotella sp.]
MFLPVSINITGKKILIIGGGKVGYHKASILSRFTDKAVIVSPDFHEGFETLPFERLKKEYEPSDLNGAFLVYICTENETLNAAVKTECERRSILASVCDNPALCDFISPAIYKNGDLTIAVSSNGKDVRRSIAIRNKISKQLSANS